MVIDTSAVAAVLFDEPDAAALEGKIADDPVRLRSAATLLEATIVIEARLGDAGGREFDLWLHRAEIEILALDAEQADLARRAWRRFGRAQLWRLLLLCAGGETRRAVAVQGRRFREDRCKALSLMSSLRCITHRWGGLAAAADRRMPDPGHRDLAAVLPDAEPIPVSPPLVPG